MDDPPRYAVIIDRISHEVPYYRTYLKHAVLAGRAPSSTTRSCGRPTTSSSARRSPRSSASRTRRRSRCRTRTTSPASCTSESLRNLDYPLDWEGIVDYVGLPCILKDAHGGGWRDVYVCHSLEELIHHYDSPAC